MRPTPFVPSRSNPSPAPLHAASATCSPALKCPEAASSPAPAPRSESSQSNGCGKAQHHVESSVKGSCSRSTSRQGQLSSLETAPQGEVLHVRESPMQYEAQSAQLTTESTAVPFVGANRTVISSQRRASSTTPTEMNGAQGRPQILRRSSSTSNNTSCGEKPLLILPELRLSPSDLGVGATDEGTSSSLVGPSLPQPPLLSLTPSCQAAALAVGGAVMPLSLVSPSQSQHNPSPGEVLGPAQDAADALTSCVVEKKPPAAPAVRSSRTNSTSTDRIASYNAKKKQEEERAKEEERRKWEKKDPLAAKRRDFEKRRNELYAWNSYLRDAARKRWGEGTSTVAQTSGASNLTAHALLDSGQGTREGTQQILQEIMDGV